LKHIILLFALTLYIVNVYSQNAQVLINQEYIKKNQIKNITFFVPVSIEWINNHPAFSRQMNIKQLVAEYDKEGFCTKIMWRLCNWDSAQQNIDTSINSLEHYLYFKYQNQKLQRIDAITFSEVNFVDFKYIDNKIVRHIAYIEDSQLKTRDDTLIDNAIPQKLLNPYDWSIYPYYQIIDLTDDFLPFFYINTLPILFFDEKLNNKTVIIELSPNIRVRIL